MKYQPDIHHRRSIRLKGYDYSQENAYFVTICTQNKRCFFGEVEDGKMLLNPAGLATIKWYQELSNKFTGLECHEFVCMPNHIHFIVQINDTETVNRIDIPTIVQWYKTMTTNEYIRGVKQNNWQPFNGRLWQRNYWERVVRNENEFNHIRDYIQTNPMRWEQDKLYTSQPVGADLRVRPIQPTNHINPSVGAHPCVRPDKPQQQTRGSKNQGQTHRSAPTGAIEVTQS